MNGGRGGAFIPLEVVKTQPECISFEWRDNEWRQGQTEAVGLRGNESGKVLEKLRKKSLVELHILVEMLFASCGVMTEQTWCLAIQAHINFYHSHALTFKSTLRVNDPPFNRYRRVLSVTPRPAVYLT